MSGRPALDVASAPRVVVRDGERTHDVFAVLDITDGVLRVRSPLLFEIGEEIAVRIEENGKTTDALARVRAHTGTIDTRVTELELLPESTA